MFIDNITWTNDTFRQQAEIVCGNNTNCLFDVAVTVDTSFGMSTKQLEENNNQINNKLGKISAKIWIRMDAQLKFFLSFLIFLIFSRSSTF